MEDDDVLWQGNDRMKKLSSSEHKLIVLFLKKGVCELHIVLNGVIGIVSNVMRNIINSISRNVAINGNAKYV